MKEMLYEVQCLKSNEDMYISYLITKRRLSSQTLKTKKTMMCTASLKTICKNV